MLTFKEWLEEEKQRLDPKCWDGYKKQGTKMKGGVRVNNCVKEEEAPVDESVQKSLLALENFKDGKVEGRSRPGRVKKAGASCKGSVSSLRAKAKKYSGEKGKMYHWCANMKGGARANNSVKEEKVDEAMGMKGMSVSSGDKRPVDKGAGLTKKGVEKYRRQNPGSKLQTAVTTPPSKLDPDSKAAKRRKSFCARSRGWTGERGKAARRRWNC